MSENSEQRYDSVNLLPHMVQLPVAALLRTHVLDTVRHRIEAGHGNFINEVRRLIILFIGFPTLKEPKRNTAPHPQVPGAIDEVQQVVEVVQRRMRQYDGSLLQFRCDEKGFLAMCAFGLPGRMHRQRCPRGIQAALKIVENMEGHRVRACVGITTGDFLCACVGNTSRSEYTVFGDAINLSARLMCKAEEGLGSIIFDRTTYERGKNVARFVPLNLMNVKGKAHLLSLYLVCTLEKRSQNSGDIVLPEPATPLSGHKPMIQRDHVIRVIESKRYFPLRWKVKEARCLSRALLEWGRRKQCQKLHERSVRSFGLGVPLSILSRDLRALETLSIASNCFTHGKKSSIRYLIMIDASGNGIMHGAEET